jgi:citrate synthase
MSDLNAFPLHEWDEKQQALLTAVLEAHAASATRNSISTNVCLNVGFGSGDYCKAMAAAILSIGDAHAPLDKVMEYLSKARSLRPTGLQTDSIIPGWGNSFVKGHDPVWNEVRGLLSSGWPDLWQLIESTTEALHARGKPVFPNPACYTAACAIILNIPKEVAAWIFIEGRLRAWTDAFLYQQTHGT